MRKLLAGATVMMLGAGATSSASAQLLLKGSDTLEDVTKGVITDCIAKPGSGLLLNDISYVGGGSGGGQSAMVGGTQRIAPMSRRLNGAQCAGTSPAVDGTGLPATQYVIGVDGVAMVGTNQTHGDSLFDGLPAGCADKITGVTLPAALIGPCLATDNCNPDGSYTFASWKEVLSMLYAGQNNSANPALSATFPKTRQINKINCASPVRKALADNWGDLFDTGCAKGAVVGNCKKLKHAFRRGDLSGTTDTFVTLAQLSVAVPAFTTIFQAAPANVAIVNPATATANPFCNAGTAPMNKGDSDYLDLDPIRRIVDVAGGGAGRVGFEQVAQAHGTIVNPPVVLGVDTRPDPTLTAALVELPDFGLGSRQNTGPNPQITAPAPNDFLTLQKNALAGRKGLGLVLPIEIPTNYADEGVAYWSPSAAPGQAPVLCDPGVTAPSTPSQFAGGICPNGSPAPCLLPVHVVSTNPTVLNFNCLVNNTLAPFPGIQDMRVYNLAVLNAAGKYVLDGYVNPALASAVPPLAASRHPRVVTAFFRLHTTQTTNLGGTPTIVADATGSVCKKLTSTDQIGCLVKANPCSVGYGGREAVDKVPSVLLPANMAYQLGTAADGSDALAANNSNIINVLHPPLPIYPMARKLYVNNWVGVTSTETPAQITAQNALLGCFQDRALTAARINQFNFLAVPAADPFPLTDPVCAP